VQTTINFEKSEVFFAKKCGRPHLKTPPVTLSALDNSLTTDVFYGQMWNSDIRKPISIDPLLLQFERSQGLAMQAKCFRKGSSLSIKDVRFRGWSRADKEEEDILRCERPHFLVQKTSVFSWFMVCPHRQGGGGCSSADKTKSENRKLNSSMSGVIVTVVQLSLLYSFANYW